jgi:transposase
MNVRVYVYREATDMRRSFEGLSYLAREVIGKDPLSGHLFLFLNRMRDAAKILYWDRSGYVIWYKRLERGTFSRPAKEELDYGELVCVLEGLEFEKMPRKRRFSADFVYR